MWRHLELNMELMLKTKMADYENVVRSSLKLKGVSDHGIKKKKKKKKDKEKEKKRMEQISSTEGQEPEAAQGPSGWRSKRTQAEIAFERATAKRSAEQILKKATKTHKDRIMEFNQHLDNLTEHFDIPKVSWTK